MPILCPPLAAGAAMNQLNLVKHQINFIFNGAEYCANFDSDGVIETLYDLSQSRYLREDTDTGIRENALVWVAAYSFLED